VHAGGEPVDWEAPACTGSAPPVPALLDAARRLAPGAEAVVAAIDMPLAAGPITGRRPCDDAVSRAFGAFGCGVHTPSAERPGPVSEALHRGFAAAGFRLATAAPIRGARHLLEVYPHTALLALLRAPYRLEYKASRARRYWPEATPAARRERLLSEWRRILRSLRRAIADVELPLPAAPPPSGRLKRYEDALDALVCAWVGIEFLAGRAVPYGDAAGAIWSPPPRAAPRRPSFTRSTARGAARR
jgi:predicted RNase H-like nuclease